MCCSKALLLQAALGAEEVGMGVVVAGVVEVVVEHAVAEEAEEGEQGEEGGGGNSGTLRG